MNKKKYYLIFLSVFILFICSTIIIPEFNSSILFSKRNISSANLFSFSKNGGFSKNSIKKIISENTFLDPALGLVIDSKKKGSFSVYCPPSKGSHITLQIDSYSIQGARYHLKLYIPYRDKVITLSKRSWMRNRYFNITKYLNYGESCIVKFVPIKSNGKIIINKIIMNQIAPSRKLPLLGTLLVMLFFAFFLFETLLINYHKDIYVWIGGLIIFLLLYIGSISNIQAIFSPWYWLFLFFVLIFYRKIDRNNSFYYSTFNELFIFVFSLGVIFRWNGFLSSFGQPLDIDPSGYLRLTQSFSLSAPYLTGFREPFYIWIQAMGNYIFGPNIYQFRLVSFILSLCTLILTYYFVLAVSENKNCALFATFLMSINEYACFSSFKSERTELFNLLVLGTCLAVYTFKNGTWFSEFTIGLLSSFLCLTWLIGGIGVFILYLCRWILRKIKVRYVLVFSLPVFVLLVPHLLLQWKTHGDPFYAVNMHAGHYWKADKVVDRLAGEIPSSWRTYVLKEIKIKRFIKGIFSGYFNLLLNPTNILNKVFLGFHYMLPYSYFMFPFYFIGIILELKRKRWWIFIFLFAFSNIFPYFIKDFIEPRYIFFLAPFFAYFWGSGVCYISHINITELIKKFKK